MKIAVNKIELNSPTCHDSKCQEGDLLARWALELEMDITACM